MQLWVLPAWDWLLVPQRTSYNGVQVISLVFLTVKWNISIIYCYVTSCHKPSDVDQVPSSSRAGSPPQSRWQTSASQGFKTETLRSEDCVSAGHSQMAASFKTGRRGRPPSSIFPQGKQTPLPKGSADEGKPTGIVSLLINSVSAD